MASFQEYLEKGRKALQAAGYVIEDPALPEVTKLLLELHALEQKARKPGAPPPKKEPGIGLKRVVKPLRMYVKARKNPLYGFAIVAGALAVPFLFGYLVGKKRKRR